jgi:YfiH family protein
MAGENVTSRTDIVQPARAAGFEWRQTPSGLALVCRALEVYAPHLFTTRRWSLGSSPDGDRTAGWEEVAHALGVDGAHLARVHQVHGASVVVRRADEPLRVADDLPQADIIVSDDSALALAIQSADCVPLLIADRRLGVVAAAHAGWRGMAARVPHVAVEALALHFGSQPRDLVAAVGPSISASRYEVGADVRECFSDAGFPASRLERWFADGDRPGHWYFDGCAAVRDQLTAAGVPANQVHVAGLCTASDPELWCSYRRDGRSAGRIVGVIRTGGRHP